MRILPVLIIAGTSLLFACKGKTQSECLVRIDSLEQVTITLKDSLDFYPYDSITGLYNDCKSIVKLCEEKLSDLPADSALKADFNRFTNIHKGFEKYVKQYSSLNDNLAYTTNQLAKLKNSIASDSLNEKQMKQQCNEQENAVIELSGGIMESLDIVRNCVSGYQKVLPSAIFIRDSLLKTNP